jgi:hypothetical protein
MSTRHVLSPARCAAAVAFLFLAPAAARARQADTDTVVNVGAAEGSPGTTVVVGVTVRAPDEAAKPTAFEQDVRFDTRVLAFERVEVSPLGSAAGLKVTSSTETDPADQNVGVVKLKATAERPMSGPVLGLMFKIKEDLKEATTTVLKTRARAQKTGQSALSDVGGKDGEVVVTKDPAIFGCFFYMH